MRCGSPTHVGIDPIGSCASILSGDLCGDWVPNAQVIGHYFDG